MPDTRSPRPPFRRRSALFWALLSLALALALLQGCCCPEAGRRLGLGAAPTYTPYPTYTPQPPAVIVVTPAPTAAPSTPLQPPSAPPTAIPPTAPPPTAVPPTAVPPTAPPPPPPPAPRARLAYTERIARGKYNLYLINLDGTGKELLEEDASEPCFTRDGQEVMFYSWRGGGVDMMRLDKTNRRRVIHDNEAAFANIAADGYKVVYLTLIPDWSKRPPQWTMRINMINLDGTGKQFVSEGDQPAWHPTEMRLVSKGCDGSKCGLFLANHDGSGRRKITDHANDQNPAWSPDGSRIAFASDRDGNWEIYVMNADGSNQRRLTNQPTTDALPVWLPDGRSIAFRSDRGGVWSIYVMDADGGNVRKVTDAACDPDRWRWERMAVLPQ